MRLGHGAGLLHVTLLQFTLCKRNCSLLNFTVVRWPLRRYSYTAALRLNNLLILLLLRFGCKPCNSSRKNEKLGKSRKAPRSRTVWDDHQGPAGGQNSLLTKAQSPGISSCSDRTCLSMGPNSGGGKRNKTKVPINLSPHNLFMRTSAHSTGNPSPRKVQQFLPQKQRQRAGGPRPR